MNWAGGRTRDDCYLHVTMFFSFLFGWLHMGGDEDRSMDVAFSLALIALID